MVRYIGLAQEFAYGTEKAVDQFMEFGTDDLVLESQSIIEDSATERIAKHATAGKVKVGGGFEGPVDLDFLGWLLKLGLGSLETTGAAAPYTHVFKPADALKSFSLEVGDEIGARKYLGCNVAALELTHTLEDVLGIRCDVAGKTGKKAAASAPTFSERARVPFHGVTLQHAAYGGTLAELADVQEIRCRYNNDLDIDGGYEFKAGERGPTGIPVAGANIELTMNLKFKTEELMEYFLGASGATEPQMTLLMMQALLKWESTEVIEGSTPETKYSLQLDIPKMVYTVWARHVDRRARLIQNVTARPLYDPSTGVEYAIMATLINGIASYPDPVS